MYQKVFHLSHSGEFQLPGMQNAILPSVSSQLCSYGNNDAISDIPLQMDSNSKVNAYSNSFCMDSKELYNDHNHDQFEVEGFAFPSQSPIDYQSGPSSSPVTIERLDYPFLGQGYLTTTTTYDNISQQSLYLSKTVSVPQFQADIQSVQSARKRPIEISNLIPEVGFNNLASSKPALNEWTTNKKKVVCLQEQWHGKEELIKAQREGGPAGRRSQKLSDRITALQKLVSPYGKTDTASVLHEASISIKVLQDQIQNLFQVMSTSHNSTKPLHSQRTGEKQLDLRSRGLCLVPISSTQKLTKEGPLDHHQAPMRKTFTQKLAIPKSLHY
ncbi:hypothetical protein F0562_026124 [Nyssa sinensis]|uniref:BHLH domain-containing protein n=1 Tax=Nyssa sinensis TaxID=561372 RepID=A0A5J5BC36_9ASTE|nr:hypothetical protein F0562_026124 [Nyssa sinensis]